MATIKWLNEKKEWVILYGKELFNRLRRDKNLSDLTNVADARTNLELVNEVTTHWHDIRYYTKTQIDALLKQLRDYIDSIKESLTNMINTEIRQRKSADSSLSSRIDSLSDSIDSLSDDMSDKIDSGLSDISNKIPTGVGEGSLSGSTGYYILGDLIIQWGEVNCSSDVTVITFPISFKNRCVNIQVTQQNATTESNCNMAAALPSKKGFHFYACGKERERPVFYLAIGY